MIDLWEYQVIMSISEMTTSEMTTSEITSEMTTEIEID